MELPLLNFLKNANWLTVTEKHGHLYIYIYHQKGFSYVLLELEYKQKNIDTKS